MAWVQNKKFYGIRKGLAGTGAKPAPEAGSCFDRTVYPALAIEAPGKHALIHTAPNPSAFSFGVSVKADINPHQFLHRHTGFGGSSTMRAATAVPKINRLEKIGKPPSTGYMDVRNNPPNTDLRRAYERGDLPCIIQQSGAKRTLTWKLEDNNLRNLDFKHYLPLFVSGLREQEQPLPLLASQGIVDLVTAAPEKVANVVPLLIIPFRHALNTRIPEVLTRTVEAMKAIATCDIKLSSGPMAAKAMVPYFRQLLAIINIYATRYRNYKNIDEAPRNVSNLEDRISELLNALELYGGPNAYINIKYMVPCYTTCKI